MIFLCSLYQQRIKNFPELLLVSDHIWWHIVSSPFFSSSVTGKMQQKKAGGKGKNLLFLTSQNPWHQLLWLSPIPERKVCVSSQESLHQAYRWWGCLWVSYSLRHYIYIYKIPLISSLWFFFWKFSFWSSIPVIQKSHRNYAWGGYFHNGRMFLVTAQFAAGDVIKHETSATLTSSQ